jgi:predicted alpha/beta-hydrolase family hydrolase
MTTRLIATTRAVIAHAQAELPPSKLLIGGRSMGGRAASMLAAEAFDAGGPSLPLMSSLTAMVYRQRSLAIGAWFHPPTAKNC